MLPNRAKRCQYRLEFWHSIKLHFSLLSLTLTAHRNFIQFLFFFVVGFFDAGKYEIIILLNIIPKKGSHFRRKCATVFTVVDDRFVFLAKSFFFPLLSHFFLFLYISISLCCSHLLFFRFTEHLHIDDNRCLASNVAYTRHAEHPKPIS